MFWLIDHELGDIAAHNRAKVFGAETSPQLLEELLVKFKDHHQSVQTLLLKQEYQRSQAMMRQKMLENLDESLKKQTQVHYVKLMLWVEGGGLGFNIYENLKPLVHFVHVSVPIYLLKSM